MKALKALIAATALFTIASSGVQGAGVPVIDSSNLTQALAQVESLTAQLNKMQEQLDTLKAQADTITNLYNEGRGVTQHATMMANSVQDLHGFFPGVEYDLGEWLSGPLNAVSSTLRGAKEMFSWEKLSGDDTAHHPSIEIYKARGDFVYGFMGAAKESYDNLAARRPKLETFVAAAGTANTPKAVQDLNARIGAEMLLMLNDIGMMQALTLTAMMEKESLAYNEAGLANYKPIETIPGTPDLSTP